MHHKVKCKHIYNELKTSKLMPVSYTGAVVMVVILLESLTVVTMIEWRAASVQTAASAPGVRLLSVLISLFWRIYPCLRRFNWVAIIYSGQF